VLLSSYPATHCIREEALFVGASVFLNIVEERLVAPSA
jgi:hypothetical protein